MRFSPSGLAKALRGIGKDLDRERANALRRVVRRARGAAVTALRQRGVGRALWGHKLGKSGATLALKTTRVVRSGTVMSAGIQAKGLAAFVEAGGRTKQHIIRPKLAGVLKLRVGSGFAFARWARHPGSNIPAQPYLPAAVASARLGLPAELELAHRRAIKKAIGL